MTDPLGLDTITQPDGPAPLAIDGSGEQEVAAAIARAVDSVAALSKLLPIDQEIASRFRVETMAAWNRLITDAGVCDADFLDEGEAG